MFPVVHPVCCLGNGCEREAQIQVRPDEIKACFFGFRLEFPKFVERVRHLARRLQHGSSSRTGSLRPKRISEVGYRHRQEKSFCLKRRPESLWSVPSGEKPSADSATICGRESSWPLGSSGLMGRFKSSTSESVALPCRDHLKGVVKDA